MRAGSHLGGGTERLGQLLNVGGLFDADGHVLDDFDFFPKPALPKKRRSSDTLTLRPLLSMKTVLVRTDDSTQMERTGYEPSPEPCGPDPPFFASLIVTRVAP